MMPKGKYIVTCLNDADERATTKNIARKLNFKGVFIFSDSNAPNKNGNANTCIIALMDVQNWQKEVSRGKGVKIRKVILGITPKAIGKLQILEPSCPVLSRLI